MTERYTPLGCGIWSWKPWIALSAHPRLLWLALYTGPEAKRSVPGLWPGTMRGMSDTVRLSLNDTYTAVNELVERKLLEFDEENRLARLTQLPDAHDRAHNSQAISGWWTRFRTLPTCPLRDSHVSVLWWMVQQGKCESAMVDRWKRTFGTIIVPDRAPPFQPPGSADTGTDCQPSLFGLRSDPNKNNNSDPSAMDQPSTAGGSDPDPDLDLVSGRGGGRHLALVPDPSPEAISAAEREAHARDMRNVIRAAGGASLLGPRWDGEAES